MQPLTVRVSVNLESCANCPPQKQVVLSKDDRILAHDTSDEVSLCRSSQTYETKTMPFGSPVYVLLRYQTNYQTIVSPSFLGTSNPCTIGLRHNRNLESVIELLWERLGMVSPDSSLREPRRIVQTVRRNSRLRTAAGSGTLDIISRRGRFTVHIA